MKRMSIATRREFLSRGLGIVGIGATLPNYVLRTALAAPEDDSKGRIVVSLLLTGGPDGMSITVPYADPAYYKLRKVLAVPETEVLKLNDQVGLHPSLKRIKQMHDNGAMAVVLGTSYPNFNLSHFTGREIWEAGRHGVATGKAGSYGWLGKCVDYVCKDTEPTRNVAVGPNGLPLGLAGKEHPGIGFVNPNSFRFNGARRTGEKDVYSRLNQMPATAPAGDLEFITQTSVNANAASQKLGDLATQYKTPVVYPDTQFGNSVKTIAAFINGGLHARAFYAAQGIAIFGGYDTHADQPRRLGQLLDELDGTVGAFYEDLARCGNADRVLTYTYSEFGRRAAENYSGGTDHGEAQPMFLFGPGVKPGVHAKYPSLSELDERGNLKMSVDFRSVYAAMLEKWWQIPVEAILPEKIAPLDCIA
ncbi:MAG: DUF1501 domain-containing protein [Planctomycetes bacterium]|nr:DUF1501 domain-containing protein [Planctomycetota bacterium]